MPLGLLVAMPGPVAVSVRRCFSSWKVAVTLRFVWPTCGVITQLASPVQSPDQPVNRLPVAGVAARVTLVPVKTSSKQSLPQLKPVPATVPVPLPVLVTRTPAMPRKSAVVLTLAFMVNAQVRFVRPLHGPPDQLRNRLPMFGVACRTTGVPRSTSRAQAPLSSGQTPPGPAMTPTLPCPRVPGGVATAKVRPWTVAKLAFTLRAVVMLTVQAPVPEQSPTQPAKIEPAAGCGSSVTLLPLGSDATQVPLEHCTPSGSLVTAPAPVTRVVRRTVGPEKSWRRKT
jgi:hypothetical protein